MTAATHTVRLHRVLTAPPERVYRAFVDADALARWLPPYGFVGRVLEMDARVGGGYRMAFTNFSSGHRHTFTATFVEMKPGERLVHTDVFDDPGLPGTMTVTVGYTPVSVGTELHIVQEGIPAVIPVESCYLGWQQSLAQLAELVQPDIPG